MLNVPMHTPVHLSAVEVNAACRDELLNGPNCPCHLFRDVNDFWRPEVRKALEELRAADLPINRLTMLPLVRSGMATQRSAHCLVHGRQCQLVKARDLWAGFPCVNWSPQGPGEKDAGVDFQLFCSMAAVTLDLEDCGWLGLGHGPAMVGVGGQPAFSRSRSLRILIY